MELRREKRFWSKEERRAIVEETLKPGTSVSQVARNHDVNANQVFAWRRQYRQGHFDPAPTATGLMPVKITAAPAKVAAATKASPKNSVAGQSGVIEVDLGHARVRIEGAADPACVRAAVEGLLR